MKPTAIRSTSGLSCHKVPGQTVAFHCVQTIWKPKQKICHSQQMTGKWPSPFHQELAHTLLKQCTEMLWQDSPGYSSIMLVQARYSQKQGLMYVVSITQNPTSPLLLVWQFDHFTRMSKLTQSIHWHWLRQWHQPLIWTDVSTLLFNILTSEHFLATFICMLSGHQCYLVWFAFVDYTNLCTNDTSRNTNKVIEKMQQFLNLWLDYYKPQEEHWFPKYASGTSLTCNGPQKGNGFIKHTKMPSN